MRYVFKLEALLNYKKRLEEVAQQALAQKTSELMLAQQKLNRLRAKQIEYLNETMKKRTEGIPAARYLLYLDYLRVLAKSIDQQEEEIETLNQELALARQNLLKLSRERKIVDKIKEKDFRAFRREVARIEQKENDELVIVGRSRTDPSRGELEYA